MSTILEGLNSEQKKAVQCVDGPVLIVAGAGSGKTRVLTSRIAYLLDQGVDAGHVLALTFTKKAATEMKERIALKVGDRKARRLRMGTFHSVFVRFLREFAVDLGYPESFTIYDQSDSTSAVKACIKELELDDKVYKPKDVLSRISMAKNNLITDAAYRSNPNIITADSHAKRPRLCDVYSLYQKKCRQAGVMDFDDILLNMNILFRDFPAALDTIASRFSHILVDEYQDTNFAQYLILKKLAQPHRNICVVGDDSQSIYAFRGAKIENILNFRKDYPDCKMFRLEQNYRSTQTIVDAANSLIAHNEGRIPKECFSRGDSGDKIRVIRTGSEQEEAMMIASTILDRMREKKARYQDFAILYRTNSQSRAIEEALRRRNLPYIVYSGNAFFDRAEVKDMMAYFKLLVNPHDDESFKRVVNKPARGIGDTSMNALGAAARAHGVSLARAAFLEDLETYGLRNAAALKIRAFCGMIGTLSGQAGTTDAHELALRIADQSGLYAFYKSDTSIEGLSRFSNVEELVNSVKTFVEERQNEILADLEEAGESEELPLVTLGDYLENVSLLSTVDATDEEDAANRIALMTVHSAKGLEFPFVFIAGLEDNLFPSGSMISSKADIEEERRLFYVALTRAMRDVILTYADTRMRNGSHESNAPSRFLREIDPRFLVNPPGQDEEEEEEDTFGGFSGFGARFGRSQGRFGGLRDNGYRYGASGAPRSFGKPQNDRKSAYVGTAQDGRTSVYAGKAAVLNRPLPPKIPDSEFVPVPMSAIKAGQRIEHNRFGGGLVEEITGTIPELKARINFDEYGVKVILLKYAKLRFETQ
ncbi:MAG: UvrD-helicase domain-containing protein [Bacteroidales bacterium]|nr:UvrD-helicase domain-containing protein [Bacteroidales bacterium]